MWIMKKTRLPNINYENVFEFSYLNVFFIYFLLNIIYSTSIALKDHLPKLEIFGIYYIY